MNRRLLPLVLFALLLSCSAAWAGHFRVNTSIKPPLSTEKEDGALDLLVRELFARIGQSAEIVRLPPERALMLANAGESDAELPRVAGMEKMYPNLVQVPEVLIHYSFVGFSKDKSIVTDSWAVLKNHRVGAVRGWKIYEQNVPMGASVEFVGSAANLFKMLEHDHIDLALHEHYTGAGIVKSLGYTDLCEVGPPLAVRPMYLYVHRKHEKLVPGLAKELAKMKADGTYHLLFAKAKAEGCEDFSQ